MRFSINTIFVFTFLLSSYSQDRTVYISKNYWHTGVVISIDKNSSRNLPALNLFGDSVLVDIGMGEKDFYMSPSRDIVPAAKAILIPTEATIRIAIVPGDTAFLRRTSDFLIELKMDTTSFNLLLEFINSSIAKNEIDIEKIIEKRAGGKIVFFESTESYHLFNTCNTWLAKALEHSGINITPSDVITSKELFRELLDKGKVLKFDTTDTIY